MENTIALFKNVENSKEDKTRDWIISWSKEGFEVKWGVSGGKIQSSAKELKSGKYVGKVNEYTIEDCVIEQVSKRVNQKLGLGYEFCVDEQSEANFETILALVDAKVDSIELAKAEQAQLKAAKAESVETESVETEAVG